MKEPDEFLLEPVSEALYPITCAACRYCLTGLGEAGRCPECGLAFERQMRLGEIYGAQLSGQDLGVDPRCDISHIDPAKFVVTCELCGTPLIAADEAGTCTQCGLHYNRRLRLFQLYGPEAFAHYESGESEPTRVSPYQFLIGTAELAFWVIFIGTVATFAATQIGTAAFRTTLRIGLMILVAATVLRVMWAFVRAWKRRWRGPDLEDDEEEGE
jgi:uncharacterized membrane protein